MSEHNQLNGFLELFDNLTIEEQTKMAFLFFGKNKERKKKNDDLEKENAQLKEKLKDELAYLSEARRDIEYQKSLISEKDKHISTVNELRDMYNRDTEKNKNLLMAREADLTRSQQQVKQLEEKLTDMELLKNNELTEKSGEINNLNREISLNMQTISLLRTELIEAKRVSVEDEKRLLTLIKADAEIQDLVLGKIINHDDGRNLVKMISSVSQFSMIDTIWSEFAKRCKGFDRSATEDEKDIISAIIGIYNINYSDENKLSLDMDTKTNTTFDYDKHQKLNTTTSGSIIEEICLSGIKQGQRFKKQTLVKLN